MAEVRWLVPSAGILAAVLLLSFVVLEPPWPRPSNAPAEEFSAERVLAVLGRIDAGDTPHPTGSTANDAVRARVLDEFTLLGYRPQVQTAFACSDGGVCATVNNVLARLDGADAGADSTAVLVAAHYDSVPAGPGASDDGAGVAAALEVARALKTLPRPRHSVIFLVDDGEEAGLLGARAFVQSHPWAREVRAAVNLEARGTSGPSLMFETGIANEWAVRLYKGSVARPATNSIFYSVYKKLPNDTDFTIFRRSGWQGLNFAFIGGVAHYHTPLDNLANVSTASLEHQGENALASVLALANADIANPPGGEAIYFDIFGRGMVMWPGKRALPFAIGVAFVLLLEIAWMVRTKRLARHEYRWGLVAMAVIAGATCVLALLLKRLIWLAGGIPVNWVAHSQPLETAFWALPVAVVVTHGFFFSRRAGFWGVWAGVSTWWALAGLATAWLAPGTSYVTAVPSCVAALAALPFIVQRTEHHSARGLAAILPLAAAAIVGFAPALLLYDAQGNRALVFIAVFVGLLLTPGIPLFALYERIPVLHKVGIGAISIVVTALAAFAAVIVPAYSAKSPERVIMRYWQDADSGDSQWIVLPQSGHLRDAIRVAAVFHHLDKGPFPWDADSGFVADAPHVDLAAPTFTILESSPMGAQRTYSALLRSERGAPDALVMFAPGAYAQSVEIEGQPAESESGHGGRYFGGWRVYECAAMPAEGVQISFTLPVGRAVQVYAVDRSYGLPPDGAFLLKARPLTATPSQDGDLTIVSRSVELNP